MLQILASSSQYFPFSLFKYTVGKYFSKFLAYSQMIYSYLKFKLIIYKTKIIRHYYI